MTKQSDIDAQDEFPATAYLRAYVALERHADGGEVMPPEALELQRGAKQHAETYFQQVGAHRALRAMARKGWA